MPNRRLTPARFVIVVPTAATARTPSLLRAGNPGESPPAAASDFQTTAALRFQSTAAASRPNNSSRPDGFGRFPHVSRRGKTFLDSPLHFSHRLRLNPSTHRRTGARKAEMLRSILRIMAAGPNAKSSGGLLNVDGAELKCGFPQAYSALRVRGCLPIALALVFVAAPAYGQVYILTDLGFLPNGKESVATSINNRGQVVGRSRVVFAGGNESERAFLWQNGQMTELGDLPGFSNTPNFATSINNNGQIVGCIGTCGDGARGSCGPTVS